MASRVLQRCMAARRALPVHGLMRGGALTVAQHRQFASAQGQYDNILVEKRDKVALITLHRPKALNALNSALINDLSHAMASLDADPAVSALVLTGSEKAFAAGADIKEMAPKSYMDNFLGNWLSNWGVISKTRKPVIAAVNGYALGGGCEVAMMCDLIYAGDNARFGQPEITIGTIPGGGGTQRLIREIGKSRAMEMILTGEQMDAAEAHRRGLVAKIFPPGETVEEAMKTAAKMAAHSLPHLMMAKQAVNDAYEVGLLQGLQGTGVHSYMHSICVCVCCVYICMYTHIHTCICVYYIHR